jgi:hypothetical protein
MRLSLFLSFILSVVAGIFVSWLHTIPHWQDTAVAVLLIFLFSFFLAYAASVKPWLIAFTVCLTIILLNVFHYHNGFFLGAIIPAFAGAYLGFITRHL